MEIERYAWSAGWLSLTGFTLMQKMHKEGPKSGVGIITKTPLTSRFGAN
jgi:hypothetical protein